jgi:hypothetical protein
LASNNPDAFAKHDSTKLALDLFHYSIVVFLMRQEPDWQFMMTEHSAEAIGLPGGKFYLAAGEPRSERRCTIFSGAHFRAKLAQANNLFANAPGIRPDTAICLPPKTIIEISKGTLKLRNPICELSFILRGSMFLESKRPPNGQPDVEEHLFSIRAQTTYFRWQAQSFDKELYREWTTRIVTGVKKLLEV